METKNNGEKMLGILGLLFSCGEKEESFEEYCNQDPEANEVAVDADCDGVLTEDDCDDSDPNTINDMDCDGVLTEDDCNDNDSTSTSVSIDADCDGVVTELDCNDNSTWDLLNTTDVNCDGYQETTIVSSSYNHTCAIASDGTVGCWGSYSLGQIEVPSKTFSEISTGYAHTCGVTMDNSLDCWGVSDEGNFDYGQVTDTPDGEFTQVASGDFHSCAITNTRTIQCWGSNEYGQSSPSEGEFYEVVTGANHSCGIKVGGEFDGEVECWGDNEEGQIDVPEAFNGLPTTFAQIAVGANHTCGLESWGQVTCWGRNSEGQSEPPSGFKFESITAGGDFTCGIIDANYGETSEGDSTSNENYPESNYGELICWGDNDDGQLNVPEEKFLQVSAGNSYVTGLTYDGGLVCWGFNNPRGNCEPPADFSAF